jgi:TolB protein
VSYRDGNGELYSVPLAGGAETRLTRTGPQEADPALSPDGKRLAYTNAATGVPKLWTAAADASGAAHATTGFGFAGSLEASPSWAPDGERLVFVSTTQGTADLFLYTRTSGAITPLLGTDAPEVEPAWSPDGEWIAFTSARAGQTDIFRLRVGTGEVEQLTNRQETDARPAWLADGRMVYIAWVDNVPRLRWLDPVDPAMVHEVPLGGGTVGRVSAVW